MLLKCSKAFCSDVASYGARLGVFVLFVFYMHVHTCCIYGVQANYNTLPVTARWDSCLVPINATVQPSYRNRDVMARNVPQISKIMPSLAAPPIRYVRDH